MPTAFDFALGLSQGRVTDPNAPEGSYVFELGHAGGQTSSDIDVGDYSEITQAITVGAEELLARITVRVIEPDTVSATVAWEIVGSLGGTPFFRRRLTSQGRELELTDLAVGLAAGGAPTDLAFRLEAVTP